MSNKTPLRYPGGKSRAVKTILPHIPANCKELCSPFLGGGSIELAVAATGTRVYGYDAFRPIVWFWKALLENPEKLASVSDSFRQLNTYIHKKKTVKAKGLPKDSFLKFRDEIKKELKKSDLQFNYNLAAKVYAINRSSFSGATLSGGFSERASYARFTDSSIDRVKNFSQPNLTVECLDFKDSIKKHPNTFMYLDPPYMLSDKQREKLYGKSGNTHADFDHEGLFELIKDRKDWVMSYSGEAKKILQMYKGFDIIDLSGKWAYGMKNVTAEEVKQIIKDKRELLENEKLDKEERKKLEKEIKDMSKMGKSSEILIKPKRKGKNC